MRKIIILLLLFAPTLVYAQYKILGIDINTTEKDFNSQIMQLGYSNSIIPFEEKQYKIRTTPNKNDDKINHIWMNYEPETKKEKKDFKSYVDKIISKYSDEYCQPKYRNTPDFESETWTFGEYSGAHISISHNYGEYENITFMFYSDSKQESRNSTSSPIIAASKQLSNVPSNTDGLFKYNNKKFVNSIDPTKDYIIVKAEGKTVQEIKNSVINSISTLFDHPDKVISTVGDNIVMVDAFASNFFYEYEGTTKIVYSFNYSLKIEIKDNRMKINRPSFSKLIGDMQFIGGRSKHIGPFGESDFFEALGESAVGYSNLQTLINNIVNKISEGITKEEDW